MAVSHGTSLLRQRSAADAGAGSSWHEVLLQATLVACRHLMTEGASRL